MSHKWLNVHITYLLLSSIIVSIKKSANNIHTVYKQQFSADIWTILKVLGIFSYKTDFFWQWFISQRIWIWMERQNFWFIFNVGYNFKRKYEIFLSLLRTCLRAHTTVTWRHKEGSTIHQIPYWNKKVPTRGFWRLTKRKKWFRKCINLLRRDRTSTRTRSWKVHAPR